jgi:hypothetical protein
MVGAGFGAGGGAAGGRPVLPEPPDGVPAGVPGDPGRTSGRSSRSSRPEFRPEFPALPARVRTPAGGEAAPPCGGALATDRPCFPRLPSAGTPPEHRRNSAGTRPRLDPNFDPSSTGTREGTLGAPGGPGVRNTAGTALDLLGKPRPWPNDLSGNRNLTTTFPAGIRPGTPGSRGPSPASRPACRPPPRARVTGRPAVAVLLAAAPRAESACNAGSGASADGTCVRGGACFVRVGVKWTCR